MKIGEGRSSQNVPNSMHRRQQVHPPDNLLQVRIIQLNTTYFKVWVVCLLSISINIKNSCTFYSVLRVFSLFDWKHSALVLCDPIKCYVKIG